MLRVFIINGKEKVKTICWLLSSTCGVVKAHVSQDLDNISPRNLTPVVERMLAGSDLCMSAVLFLILGQKEDLNVKRSDRNRVSMRHQYLFNNSGFTFI